MKPIIAVPATLALVYRAYSRNSLTPLGIVVATLTAIVHAIHPWSAPFALLVVFFLGGTTATKVKHDIKSSLTLSASSGSPSGPSAPRTHVQVLANSVCASLLILLHTYRLSSSTPTTGSSQCYPYGTDLILIGIVCNYAAVAADTFSSELGILSKSKPRLITTFRTVPPGTNGGVTLTGLLAGVAGAFTIAVTSVVLVPFCQADAGRELLGLERGWSVAQKLGFVVFVTGWGALGSVLDSVLGAVLQASVVDKRTGKIVEGSGGEKVLIDRSSTKGGKTNKESSRSVLSGSDILDNNQINLLMAASMSLGGMVVAGIYWSVPLKSILG